MPATHIMVFPTDFSDQSLVVLFWVRSMVREMNPQMHCFDRLVARR